MPNVTQIQDLIWEGSEVGDSKLVHSMLHLGSDLLQARDPKTFNSYLEGNKVQV